MVVQWGVCVHVVLEDVLPEPAFAGEADDVESHVSPVSVLGLMNPVVAITANHSSGEPKGDGDSIVAAHIKHCPHNKIQNNHAPPQN